MSQQTITQLTKTELIKLTKLTTLEKLELLCPKWMFAISIKSDNDQQRYRINNKLGWGRHDRCLVGEAHGFSDRYLTSDNNCETCELFSLNGTIATLAYRAFDREELDIFIDRNYEFAYLIDHIEQVHPELCKW
jgi:hypothetical protein